MSAEQLLRLLLLLAQGAALGFSVGELLGVTAPGALVWTLLGACVGVWAGLTSQRPPDSPV